MLEAHVEAESVSLALELHHRRLDELFDRVEITDPSRGRSVLVTLTAGVGGSLLSVGSAAGSR